MSKLPSREVQYLETQEKPVADSITGMISGSDLGFPALALNEHHLSSAGKLWVLAPTCLGSQK